MVPFKRLPGRGRTHQPVADIRSIGPRCGNGRYAARIEWIKRQVRDELDKFPAVAILGPRQCGKTTLAQQFHGVYFDMEIEGSEARLDAEWETLVNGNTLIVIDEAQQTPWIFSRLRGTIDSERKRNGRFLVLGSVSPTLMKNVSESLAGRMGIVHMTPFILPELKAGLLDDM